MYNTNRVLMKA